jgi:carbon storage regulator
MLVLSRKKDQKVMIGDNVEVTVVEIRGDTVKLGISAPKEVAIHRAEVYEAIRQANLEASTPPKVDLEELARKVAPSKRAGKDQAKSEE